MILQIKCTPLRRVSMSPDDDKLQKSNSIECCLIFPDFFLCQHQLYNFYVCMHHGPTELEDILRAFEELSVSIVDLTDYLFNGRNFNVIYLYVFKLVCTRWENFIRIGITVLYLKSCRCQLWIWRSQISVWLAQLRVASKTAFATVKSTLFKYSTVI
jgi:hypothetical protein